MSKWVWATVLALGCVGAARGEEEAGKSRGPLVPLKVQVVFTRTLGEKKISSMPYTLSVHAGSDGTAVRMGIQIPLTVRVDANTPATVMFKDVGTNLDCSAESLEDGRFKLDFSLEQGALASGDWGAVSSTPVLRNFKARSSLILRDGQTGRYVAATDPVTGEVLQIDVTLNLVK